MEKLIEIKLDKETPKYYKFKFSDEEIIATIYLKKELFTTPPETITLRCNA